MPTYVNRQLITQTVLDSGALATLGAVVHQFPEPGEYHGAIFEGERERATFLLAVEKDSDASQVDIDLGNLGLASGGVVQSDPCGCKGGSAGESESADTPRFTVGVRGHALFYSSRAGTLSVRVNRVGEERVVFDSRELRDGDVFAATLIRPGSYAVSNAIARSKGSVVVAYPGLYHLGGPPSAPVTIDVTSDGLIVTDGGGSLDRMGVQPGQGQIYRIRAPARIRLELVDPDDGPPNRPTGTMGTWRRQSGPREQPKA